MKIMIVFLLFRLADYLWVLHKIEEKSLFWQWDQVCCLTLLKAFGKDLTLWNIKFPLEFVVFSLDNFFTLFTCISIILYVVSLSFLPAFSQGKKVDFFFHNEHHQQQKKTQTIYGQTIVISLYTKLSKEQKTLLNYKHFFSAYKYEILNALRRKTECAIQFIESLCRKTFH